MCMEFQRQYDEDKLYLVFYRGAVLWPSISDLIILQELYVSSLHSGL
jgi:hypothetical protein